MSQYLFTEPVLSRLGGLQLHKDHHVKYLDRTQSGHSLKFPVAKIPVQTISIHLSGYQNPEQEKDLPLLATTLVDR
jgi:hypothetical protein